MLIMVPKAHILVTMWFLIFMSAVLYCASGEVIPENVVFNKCCLNGQSLLKSSDTKDLDGVYQCIDREVAYKNYSTDITPLFIGENIQIKHGIPEDCELQTVQMTLVTLDDGLKSSKQSCYDRLELEIVNGTSLKPYIPKIVALSCVKNDSHATSERNIVNHFRKCCPSGQSYDTDFHSCRKTTEKNTADWLLNRLAIKENYIYEVEHVLHCKDDDYNMELKEPFFSLEVNGSTLSVLKKNDGSNNEILPGEWCIDRMYSGQSLVARVCSRVCLYGAFCPKKCCPIGFHFKPRHCGTFASVCARNKDEVLFNITDYLEHLLRDNSALTDVMGIGTGLNCKAGRIVLNKSSVIDRHALDPAGHLISPISTGYDYCLEGFDMRHCNSTVITTAVNCFVKSPDKDFHAQFIMICITIVCLGLTLVVYLSLPELRNLHGRTLICHVSTMLLAFSCLARVQYKRVPDDTVCTLLGYGIYFGFVAAFAWLNVMCFDIWWTFGSVRTVQPMRKANAELRRFIWYSLYAWSGSTLLTLIMFLFDKYPVASFLDANIGTGVCWFSSIQNTRSDWPHYIFFVIPMGLVTCTNFVLWVLTARHCARVKSEVHRLQAGSVGDRAKRRFRVDRAKYVLTGKLWVVMGAGWVSELLSTVASEPRWFWMIVDFINSLQGVFIFIILVIKPKLYYLIRKRLGLEKPDAQKNGTSSSSARTSSTILSRALSTDERARLSLQNGKQS